MKTLITMIVFSAAVALGGCNDKKDDGEGKDTKEVTDEKASDAGAKKEEAAAKEVPTEEDFETTAANEITRETLEKDVKELEEELGNE